MTTTVPTPASIIELDKLYFEHFDAMAQASERFEGIVDRLKELTASHYPKIGAEAEIRDFLGKDVPQYRGRVIEIAAEALSTPLSPFKASDLDPLKRAFEKANDVYRYNYDKSYKDCIKEIRKASEACSPIKVWNDLLAHFDPEAQNKAEASLQANVLGGELMPHIYAPRYWREEPKDPAEMKLVKGRVEVALNVGVGESYSPLQAKRLSYSTSVQSFGKAMDFALRQVEPGRIPVCGHQLVRLCYEFELSRRPLISRERIDLGDGVDVVVGYKQFKLYLPQEIAASLNLFIAEFGRPPKHR